MASMKATLLEDVPVSMEEKTEKVQYDIARLNETVLQKEARLRMLKRIGPCLYRSWIAPNTFMGDSDYVMACPTVFHAHRCSNEFGNHDLVFRTATMAGYYGNDKRAQAR